MTESVKEPDHPSSMRLERLQQVEHLLVRSPIPPRQMVHHDVFEVEVTNRDLIGIPV